MCEIRVADSVTVIQDSTYQWTESVESSNFAHVPWTYAVLFILLLLKVWEIVDGVCTVNVGCWTKSRILPSKWRRRWCDCRQGLLGDTASYAMSHVQRGQFIIINNKNFVNTAQLVTRRSADHDVNMLRTAFSRLGFDVIVHSDKTARQMFAIVAESTYFLHSLLCRVLPRLLLLRCNTSDIRNHMSWLESLLHLQCHFHSVTSCSRFFLLVIAVFDD